MRPASSTRSSATSTPRPPASTPQITDEIKGAPEWRGCGDDCGGADYDAAKFTADAGHQAAHMPTAPPATPRIRTRMRTACILKLTFSKPAPYFHTDHGLWVTYPAKEENYRRGRRELVEQLQVPDRQRPLRPEEPRAVRAGPPSRPNAELLAATRPTYNLEYPYITDYGRRLRGLQEQRVRHHRLRPLKTSRRSRPTRTSRRSIMIYPGSCTTVIKLGLAATYKDPSATIRSRSPIRRCARRSPTRSTREGWVKDVDQGLSTPTWTWIPPGYPGYDPEATRWGSTLNWQEGAGRVDVRQRGEADALGLKITFGDTPRNRVRSEWLAANWKTHAGRRHRARPGRVRPPSPP